MVRTPRGEPRDGLVLDSWIEDGPAHAAQILPRDRRAREETVIPTAGIAHEGVQYLHAMSVREWNAPGRWRTNYAALWSSRDAGRSWQPTGVLVPSPVAVAAPGRVAVPDGGLHP
ncbi:MAG: DUF4185 domain-containing protein [Actinomycetota bacterium]|nr:DUF4185 domain-containing protein [Actinomycetota bacterium]